MASFVIDEDQRLAPNDGTSQVGTELVAFKRRRLARSQVEKVAGIQCVVTQEFEQFTVELVRARACRYVDDGPRAVAVFRTEGGAVDFELLNSADRRLEHDAAEKLVVQHNAVDHVIDCVLAVASRVDPESPQTSRRRGIESVH